MLRWLNSMEWTRVGPTEVKWTMITRTGRGITDFVFVNRHAKSLCPIWCARERVYCRIGPPSTFEVRLHQNYFKPEFQRINIRKLLRMTKYDKELRKGRIQVLTELTALMEGSTTPRMQGNHDLGMSPRESGCSHDNRGGDWLVNAV